jgi:hypothetical protein
LPYPWIEQANPGVSALSADGKESIVGFAGRTVPQTVPGSTTR